MKTSALLSIPFTVTATFPEVAVAGAGTTMDVSLQLVGVALVPLNVTVLVPWVGPKFVPVTATEVPAPPELGDRPVMVGPGAAVTVKLSPLLLTPPTVTTTLPVLAPLGTGARREVLLQPVGVAAMPPNVTVFVPCVEPKFVPVIVTGVPTVPEAGERLVMLGGVTTVKLTPLLAAPPTVTTTGPDVAPAGTGTTIEVALQLVGVVGVPLNVTVLVPCVEPKFDPLMVTGVPIDPDSGDRLVMLPVSRTMKLAPLLATPFTVTKTLPVVAPLGTGTTILLEVQLVGVPTVPLNVTVLVPWVEPKFEPAIVTDAPTGSDVGDTLVILGTGGTVKLTPLLAAPPTVTTTGPDVAPAGTGTTIEVALQLVGVVGVPLNVTVLVPCVEPKFDPLMVTGVPNGPELGDTLVAVEVILFQYEPLEFEMMTSIWLGPPLLKYCDHLSTEVFAD